MEVMCGSARKDTVSKRRGCILWRGGVKREIPVKNPEIQEYRVSVDTLTIVPGKAAWREANSLGKLHVPGFCCSPWEWVAFVEPSPKPAMQAAGCPGAVVDALGGVIRDAAVTLQDGSRGILRKTLTDEFGHYRFVLAEPGEYEVLFEKENFQPALFKGIRIGVGRVAIVDAELQVGAVFEVVVVEGGTQLVDPERSQQATTLSDQSISNLPIDRRDYLTFALLAPGVVGATALADETDLRVKQTPHSGLSFFGSNGRGNSVSVDGGEVNDGGGGVRSTISQEAVEEFQINRSNYAAEFGGASGAVINIVSKTGTNAVHGSAFGFFRRQSLDAGDPFARVLDKGVLRRTKPPSKRGQFGGSLGGPIRKNRTFFFAAFEVLVRRESSVVSLLTDTSIFGPTAAQEQVLQLLPPGDANVLRGALTSPQSTIDLFQQNSGVFPFRTDSRRFSFRLDHNYGERHRLTFRHSYADLTESNGNLQALLGVSRGTEIEQFDPTTGLGLTSVLSPSVTNEFRAQWNYRRFNVHSREKFGPEFRIGNFGIFNRDYLLPSLNIERRYELKDNVSVMSGSHLFKFGGQSLIRGAHAEGHVFFGGRFTFGDLPGNLLHPLLPPSFTINALQSFNLGLAQTFQIGMGDPLLASTNPTTGVYVQDRWKVLPNLTLDFGVRYELDSREQPLPTDTNNVAPRFAFAWNPSGDRMTTIRGGYGIFYSPHYYQIDWVVNVLNEIGGRRQIAQAFSSILTPGPAAAHNIFTTLRDTGVIGIPQPTRALRADDLQQFGLSFDQTGPRPPFSVLFEPAPNLVNPYAQQAGFAIERQLGTQWAVAAGYTYVRTLKIVRQRDTNLLMPPVDPALGIRRWSNPVRDFQDPLLAQRNYVESSANAFYSGMTVELKRRFSRSFSLNANYTLSRATDEVVDFNSDFEANDQTNLRAERGLSSFDQRHKFVAFGLWDAPGGFRIAPIFRANSGRPFNLLVGSDINLDRHETTDRPPFAGRNTGIGPNFWTFDLRFARTILFGDNSRLELIAEGFNVFNHLNFASVNNVVGNISGPFRLRGRHDRLPSEPLGFTSAHSPRRVQLGVRLTF